MSDGKTYFDAEAEAKAKQRKQEQGSDTPEYILKKPITAEVRQRYDVENDEYSYWHIPVGDKYKVDLSKEVFNELFEPLDRQALRKQVLMQISLHAGWTIGPGAEKSEAFADALLALFGLENKEETQ